MTQSDTVEGAHSDVAPVLSGAPLTPALRPLLYINDLTCPGFYPRSIVNLFADDVLLYPALQVPATSWPYKSSCKISVEQWSLENHLQPNVLKCKVMIIT